MKQHSVAILWIDIEFLIVGSSIIYSTVIRKIFNIAKLNNSTTILVWPIAG